MPLARTAHITTDGNWTTRSKFISCYSSGSSFTGSYAWRTQQNKAMRLIGMNWHSVASTLVINTDELEAFFCREAYPAQRRLQPCLHVCFSRQVGSSNSHSQPIFQSQSLLPGMKMMRMMRKMLKPERVVISQPFCFCFLWLGKEDGTIKGTMERVGMDPYLKTEKGLLNKRNV